MTDPTSTNGNSLGPSERIVWPPLAWAGSPLDRWICVIEEMLSGDQLRAQRAYLSLIGVNSAVELPELLTAASLLLESAFGEGAPDDPNRMYEIISELQSVPGAAVIIQDEAVFEGLQALRQVRATQKIDSADFDHVFIRTLGLLGAVAQRQAFIHQVPVSTVLEAAIPLN